MPCLAKKPVPGGRLWAACLLPALCLPLLVGCAGRTSDDQGEGSGAAVRQRVGPEHPNVLLIVLDTLRADRLGCYGHRRNTSPNIDRIASRAIVFDQAFANSDGTILTHISLLTSRYTAPPEYGPGPTQTLAEAFSQAGYSTYGIAANPTLDTSAGWGRGFDRYTDQPVDLAILDQLKNERRFSRQIEVRSADQTTEHVLKALQRHRDANRDSPWFLFVNYLDPHDPYTERQPWSDEFRESSSNLSGTLRSGEWFTLWDWVGRVLPTLSEDDIRRLGELYDAEIRYMDTHLHRVFDYLAETGQDEDTIVLITSDHGEVLGEHNLFTHMLGCYEVELKVPLILSIPWLTHAQIRWPELTESVDVGPTLLTLCNIPIPQAFQGRSLIDARGRLLRIGRSYTRHTHAAVSSQQRRQYGFPPESVSDSVVLRLGDSKIYFLSDGSFLMFDIRNYPDPVAVTTFADLVPLFNRSEAPMSLDQREMPEDLRKALRDIGYLEWAAPDTSADARPLTPPSPEGAERPGP